MSLHIYATDIGIVCYMPVVHTQKLRENEETNPEF